MNQKDIIKIDSARYKVKSEKEKDKFYLVDLDMKWCECPSFFFKKKECKHIKMAREFSLTKEI